MYVCICNGINQKTIEKTIEAGATTMKALYNELQIGNQCGKCCQCAKSILNQSLIKLANTQEQVA